MSLSVFMFSCIKTCLQVLSPNLEVVSINHVKSDGSGTYKSVYEHGEGEGLQTASLSGSKRSMICLGSENMYKRALVVLSFVYFT